jgi:hypothetical protein
LMLLYKIPLKLHFWGLCYSLLGSILRLQDAM